MIHWKKEGEEIRQGISIYHPKDKHSIGGCIRIGNRMWKIRYSKFTKIWYAGYHKADPDAYENFLKGHK
jgi:hypothetical protein